MHNKSIVIIILNIMLFVKLRIRMYMFVFCLFLFILWCCFFLFVDLSFWPISFSLSLMSFLQARSTGNNSLNFILSEKVFIAPSFLKNDFAGYRILGWRLFFVVVLSTYSIFHSILFLLEWFLRGWWMRFFFFFLSR